MDDRDQNGKLMDGMDFSMDSAVRSGTRRNSVDCYVTVCTVTLVQ